MLGRVDRWAPQAHSVLVARLAQVDLLDLADQWAQAVQQGFKDRKDQMGLAVVTQAAPGGQAVQKDRLDPADRPGRWDLVDQLDHLDRLDQLDQPDQMDQPAQLV